MMEEGVKYMDMFARQEFETQVYDEIDIVSTAYNTFRKVQLEQDEDLETFKKAKGQLKERLENHLPLLNLYRILIFLIKISIKMMAE